MEKALVNHKIRRFALIDQHDTCVTSEDLLKHTFVILYFYPKDNTPG